MSDEELIAERERKAAELRSAGRNPYANGFAPTHTMADVIAKFPGVSAPPEPEAKDGQKAAEPAPLSDERFRIAGRIVAHRGFGKATFVKLRDHTGELQVYVKKDKVGDAEYEIWRKMERGDFVGATG